MYQTREIMIFTFVLMLLSGVFANNICDNIQIEMLKSSPDPVPDNSPFTIDLLVKNNGTNKQEIKIDIISNSFFTGFVSQQYSSFELKENETKLVNYYIVSKDLVLTNNPLEIIFSIDDQKCIKTILINGEIETKYIDLNIENYKQKDNNNIEYELVLEPSEKYYDVNLEFKIENKNVMILEKDNYIRIKEINSTTKIPIKMYLDNSIDSGIVLIPVNINYKDSNGNIFNSQHQLPIIVIFEDNLKVGKISSVPSKLVRDTKTNKINIEIVNGGKEEIKDIVTKLIVDSNTFEPSYFGADQSRLGLIESSQYKTADFYFDISKEAAGQINAYLELEYTYQNKNLKKTIPITLNINKAPYFEIVQENYEKNSKNEVRFKVKNIGEECKDIEVTGLTRNLPITWDLNSDVISKLKNNEEQEIVLEMKFTDLAVEKIYTIPIRIRCTYNNEPVVQEEQIYISSHGKDFNIIPFILLGGIVLGVVTLIGKYFVSKKSE